MRAITAVCSYSSPQALINLDTWSGAAMGVQVNVTNGGAYSLDLSFDDPNSLIWPIPLLSMAWDASMLPTNVTNSFTSTTFSLPAAPIWFRVRHVNGVGQTRATFLQLGIHSRSNITIPQNDLLVTGPNFNRAVNGRD